MAQKNMQNPLLQAQQARERNAQSGSSKAEKKKKQSLVVVGDCPYHRGQKLLQKKNSQIYCKRGGTQCYLDAAEAGKL